MTFGSAVLNNYQNSLESFVVFMSEFYRSPVAKLSEVKTEFNQNSAPSMAPFSSRGPNKIEAAILKVYYYYFLFSVIFDLDINANRIK